MQVSPRRFRVPLQFGRLVVAAGLAACAACRVLAADVLVVGDLARAEAFRQRLQAATLQVRAGTAEDLQHLDATQTPVAVVAVEKPLPPDVRRSLSRYLGAGGHVAVVGGRAFDYAPEPANAVVISRYGPGGNYAVREPSDEAGEPARREDVTTPEGAPAVSFRSYLQGLRALSVEFDVGKLSSPARSVLQFWAKGDAYMDVAAIVVLDRRGHRWLGFAALQPQWTQQTVSLADLLPEDWAKPDEPYPLLRPEDVQTIGIGVDRRALWTEKPMTFALGPVALAENRLGIYAPTSALPPLRLRFRQVGIETPAWLFDPFAGAGRLPTAGTLHRVGGSAPTAPLAAATDPAWLCPIANVELPGTRMGTDNRREYMTKFVREAREIPLWEARAGDGTPLGRVAELRIAAAGPNKGANVALFGVSAAAVAASPALAGDVAATITRMALQPKIAGVTVNARAKGDEVVPVLSVVVQNPLSAEVRGELRVDVADGRLRGTHGVTVPARGTIAVAVPLNTVGPDFPFARFDWSVILETPAGRDELRDRVDAERGLLHASRHLLNTQAIYPDGRLSNHYFGDAYGARAMLGYADLLRREPVRLRQNADLWRSVSPEAIENGALRFFDMLVRRQNEDGSLPMGYGESIHSSNVADGGQMALGVGQVVPLIRDRHRQDDYLQFCRRFAAFAETFYIDEKLSAELAEKYPKQAAKGETAAGHYGLGWGHLVRNQTGPSWVLPDILGVQTLLTYLDTNPEYARIADRNVRYFVESGYGAAGYFHAEALIWSHLTTPDAALRERIADTLRSSFLATLLKGEPNDMYDHGARTFLKGLPLLYYRRFIEDTPAVRAVELKYIWAFASEDAPNAMRRVAETFPKPIHGESIAATKQAACGSIFALELIAPGSTLLRDPAFPRVPARK